MILTHLDIFYSREDRKVAICPFDDNNKLPGLPPADFSNLANAFFAYITLTATCSDITSSCIEYDVECPDLLNEMDVDDYLKNQSVLSWYGWF